MAGLADLLGALVADVTRARLQADLEAARVAEIYRSVPLLEGAPVPRFRLPTISFDVPVVLDEVTGEGSAPDRAVPPPDRKGLTAAVDRALQRSGIALSPTGVKRLRTDVWSERTARWPEPLDFTSALRASRQLSEDLARDVEAAYQPSTRPRRGTAREPVAEAPEERRAAVDQFRREIAVELQKHVLGQSAAQPRVMVDASSARVRELNEPTLVTRMSITLQEDAFELVSIDWGDGVERERLVPE